MMLKSIVLVLVLWVGWWVWRRDRLRDEETAAPPTPNPPRAPQTTEMVACSLCGLHVPAAEAVVGPHGVYCCEQHRRAHRR